MKFKDIPQFTSNGSWECDFELDRLVKQIEEWNNEFGLNMNPDFQRGNVWNEEQQVSYLEFLLRGGKTARVLYFNNPNWNRYKPGKDDMVCVDGLQRYTAIKKFINNEIKVFGYYFNEYEDSPRMIKNTIRVNINDLQTREEVLQWYLDFNTGGTVHSKEEIEKVKELLAKEQNNVK